MAVKTPIIMLLLLVTYMKSSQAIASGFKFSRLSDGKLAKREAGAEKEALSHLVNGLKDKPSAVLKSRVHQKIQEYLCVIEDPHCKGELAVHTEAELAQDGVNCDETPGHDLCLAARVLVDPNEKLTDEDLKSALLKLAAESIGNDFSYISALDQISEALNAFICLREGKECEFWR